jgi:3-oxoacyl-[acyl-carrier-protein] synthase II
MADESEIVITGIGVVSPIGIGKIPFWNALRESRNGIATIEAYDPSALPIRFGGEIRDFDPKAHVKPRKSLKVMCREIQTGFSAGALAMADAGLEHGSVEPDRLGVIFGSELFYSDPRDMRNVYAACTEDQDFDMEIWGSKGINRLYPLWMLMYLPNMVACHLGIAYDGRGHNNTFTVGDVSSLQAVIEAAEILRRSRADVMLTGGVGTRLNLTSTLYRSTANLSHRNDDPAAASRPFERDRDGMVNGEGAGALVLERKSFAERRGAMIYASLAGWNCSFETVVAGQPFEGTGIAAAIHASLRHANLTADDISHVNAHGSGSLHGDQAEAHAIQQQLGDTPVTAMKSCFGNLGTGSGAIELVGAALCIEQDLVPATRNYVNADPKCPVHVIRDTPLTEKQQAAVVLSYSGTGQAASVVLRKP